MPSKFGKAIHLRCIIHTEESRSSGSSSRPPYSRGNTSCVTPFSPCTPTMANIQFFCVMTNHTMNTKAVEGSVNAQYTQKLSCITDAWSQRSDGTANKAAKKVAGRKAMVMTAMVFIAELSRLLAVATVMLASASSCVRRANSWNGLISKRP